MESGDLQSVGNMYRIYTSAESGSGRGENSCWLSLTAGSTPLASEEFTLRTVNESGDPLFRSLYHQRTFCNLSDTSDVQTIDLEADGSQNSTETRICQHFFANAAAQQQQHSDSCTDHMDVQIRQDAEIAKILQ